MIKSFLNYPGGKYRLLKQILPLFPSAYSQFIDMFAGSAVVSVNALLNVPTHAYDNNAQLISLLRFVQRTPVDELVIGVKQLVGEYGLTDTNAHGYAFYESDSAKGLGSVNKEAYMKLRQAYNAAVADGESADLLLYTLVVFGFNNQMRFNRKGEFNNPVGKRDFNKQMEQKLIDFSDRVKNMDIEFNQSDFREVTADVHDGFFYVDPPYLITTAVYNENGGWTEQDESDLLNKLDEINAAGNKFALSNVLSMKGKTNDMLLAWSEKYNVNHLSMSYGNSNYQTKENGMTDEVLITNY